MAQDRGEGEGVWLVVFGCEHASVERVCAEKVEVVPGDDLAAREMGLALDREVQPRETAERDQVGEAREAGPQVLVDGVGERGRDAGVARARVHVAVVRPHEARAKTVEPNEPPELLRLRHKKQPQQNGVDGAEENCAHPDADRQNGDRKKREDGSPPELAPRKAQIRTELVHEPQADRFAALLLVPLHSPELDPRLAKSIGSGELLAGQLLRSGGDMERYLVSHLPLETSAPHDTPQPAPEPGPHFKPPGAARQGRSPPPPRTAPSWPPRLGAVSAGPSESVELGPAVVVGGAPLRLEKAPMFEAVERGVERSLLDSEGLPAHLLDPQEDPVPVLGTERCGLEDEEVEGSGQDGGALGQGVPPKLL
jgi:hypothetical protein